jgi:hypothetical protein
MKKALLLLLTTITFSSCSSDADAPIFLPPVKVEPNLTTQAPTFYVGGVKFNGTVVSEGSRGYIQKGFCWSVNTNPIVSDNTVDADGSGEGAYISTRDYNSDLDHNKTYNVRAFVTVQGSSNVYTVYGNNVTFTTP